MQSVLFAAGVAVAAAAPKWSELSTSYTFAQWRQEFKTPTNWPVSEAAFNANLKDAMAWNADASHSWKKGINKFSGMTPAAFKKHVIGAGIDKSRPSIAAATPADLSKHVPVSALPSSVDWRTKGVVTAVKDQGQCGGCWAFSAAETLESAVAIATGKLLTFSEQEILDCTPNPNQCGGTGGCSGATQELAFGYVMQAGIVTEAAYPYTARTGTCSMAGKTPVANITGYVTTPFNNYTALINSVATVGPIAISAAAEPWMSYETGVFNSCSGTSGSDIDHAIVLEGYGTDATTGKDFWLVRNSWSAGWGEAGYIRIQRFGDGKEPCNTDNTPGDGDGCKGGPSSIKVCGECGILSDSSYPTGAYLL
jgi:cathepsin L